MSNNMTDQRREVARKIEPGVNDVYLVGVVEKEPVYVYSQHGYRMYEGMLEVERRSGEIDHLPFIGAESAVDWIAFGDYVAISGRMEHRDKSVFRVCEYRTVVNVESACQAAADWPSQNTVTMSGHICRSPVFRTTPRGRDLCELTLAVPRGNGPQDYILCIAWNDMAHIARNLAVGTGISVSGRFQSRRYTKRLPNGEREERFAYEVSLDSLC